MHKIETIKNGPSDLEKRQFAKHAMGAKPFGPAFKQEQVDEAEEMVVWGSSFNDEGPDFVEFCLIKDNETIHKTRVGGY
jgi:hypothetical protein